MSSRDEWFRSPAWTSEDQQAFEAKLAGARPHGRAQYLRIKGLALREAGLGDAAAVLWQRVCADYPGSLHETSALEHLGDLAREQGRHEDAVAYYERPLDGRSLNGTTWAVHVSLAELLVQMGRFEEATEALLRRPIQELTLHHSLFRWHACAAEAALGLGDRSEAVNAAARASDLLSAPDQFSRHPGVGRAVGSVEQQERLRSIRDGRNVEPLGVGAGQSRS